VSVTELAYGVISKIVDKLRQGNKNCGSYTRKCDTTNMYTSSCVRE